MPPTPFSMPSGPYYIPPLLVGTYQPLGSSCCQLLALALWPVSLLAACRPLKNSVMLPRAVGKRGRPKAPRRGEGPPKRLKKKKARSQLARGGQTSEFNPSGFPLSKDWPIQFFSYSSHPRRIGQASHGRALKAQFSFLGPTSGRQSSETVIQPLYAIEFKVEQRCASLKTIARQPTRSSSSVSPWQTFDPSELSRRKGLSCNLA
jgi:hypothetical protein